ncbi:hypothetical protein QBC47DRAFT_443016 [Echria macrotheca]|uniref:Uncharacterized protein n=1 Tax=Echria macrotheca TaxID=438768 RepID=A0AAJ0BIP5_9PEZI|nr:hypothetical protein QBC47DRAFT_443016 [Echria macrotheca]
MAKDDPLIEVEPLSIFPVDFRPADEVAAAELAAAEVAYTPTGGSRTSAAASGTAGMTSGASSQRTSFWSQSQSAAGHGSMVPPNIFGAELAAFQKNLGMCAGLSEEDADMEERNLRNHLVERLRRYMKAVGRIMALWKDMSGLGDREDTDSEDSDGESVIQVMHQPIDNVFQENVEFFGNIVPGWYQGGHLIPGDNDLGRLPTGESERYLSGWVQCMLLPMSPRVQALWDRYAFSLRPIEFAPDPVHQILLQMVWLKYTHVDGGALGGKSHLLQENTSYVPLRQRITHGGTFRLVTGNPTYYTKESGGQPLPWLKLLEMRHAVQKVMAGAKACISSYEIMGMDFDTMAVILPQIGVKPPDPPPIPDPNPGPNAGANPHPKPLEDVRTKELFKHAWKRVGKRAPWKDKKK